MFIRSGFARRLLHLLTVVSLLVIAILAGAEPLPTVYATAPTTLSLDGYGDYVRVPNSPALNPSGGLTIEA